MLKASATFVADENAKNLNGKCIFRWSFLHFYTLRSSDTFNKKAYLVPLYQNLSYPAKIITRINAILK